jgi:hypothetical protein
MLTLVIWLSIIRQLLICESVIYFDESHDEEQKGMSIAETAQLEV